MSTVQNVLSIGLIIFGIIETLEGYWGNPNKSDSHLIRAILMFTLAGLH